MEIFIVLFLLVGTLTAIARYRFEDDKPYDFCYGCAAHASYVRVKGKDSKKLRKKVYNKTGCKIMYVFDSCERHSFGNLVYIRYVK